ncbi:hypothetical protein SRHO_G00293880 [Serrasalmus rhombeus]
MSSRVKGPLKILKATLVPVPRRNPPAVLIQLWEEKQSESRKEGGGDEEKEPLAGRTHTAEGTKPGQSSQLMIHFLWTLSMQKLPSCLLELAFITGKNGVSHHHVCRLKMAPGFKVGNSV